MNFKNVRKGADEKFIIQHVGRIYLPCKHRNQIKPGSQIYTTIDQKSGLLLLIYKFII